MIGAGGWGTAMMIELAGRNNDLIMYCRNPARADEMRKTRENGEYLVKLQAFRQIEGGDGETFSERGAVPVKKGEGIFYIETSGGEFFTENLVSLLGLRGGA